jgi:uncharacterized sulfatase
LNLKTIFILWIAIAIRLLCSCGIKNQDQTPPSPNILIILADDLGWNQLGCYGGPYHTPGIDALASRGMRFTDAYASAAVCSPTRSALMTGKYPARLRITDFIRGQDFPDSLLLQPEWQQFLPLDEVTLGEAFREHGYRTAIFGKWHLSIDKKPPESEAYNPHRQGFDEYLITYKPVRGVTNPEHDPHNVDSITERSIHFLEENQDKSFLLVVSHNAIHDPIMESRTRISEFEQSDPAPEYRVVPELGAMVSRLDEGTGKLLRKLEQLGLEENTIVFFCSDNGGRDVYASQRPFRRGKGWLYEGGIHVPMIVRWPGLIEAGTTTGHVISTTDIFPTLLELAGLPPAGHPIDGKSFAGVLLGNQQAGHRTQYWHYPHYHGGSGMKPASALLKENYKLIEWHEELLKGEPAWELYDLGSDPGEARNLAQEEPELLEALRNELDQWRMDVGAQMPRLR